MNSFLPLCDVFLFIFWKKVKSPKRHFEIIWTLVKRKKRNVDLGIKTLWYILTQMTINRYSEKKMSQYISHSFDSLYDEYVMKLLPFDEFFDAREPKTSFAREFLFYFSKNSSNHCINVTKRTVIFWPSKNILTLLRLNG